MRLAIPLVVALSALALAGCGGDDKPAAPLPIAQRFVSAEDAPGTKPDPVETRKTTTNHDGFILALADLAVDPDDDEMREAFPKADFKAAGIDLRFYGKTHSPTAPHVVSTFTELESEDAATRGLDWFEADSKKPCPQSCAVEISTFDVDADKDARGVHRIATAEDVKDHGFPGEMPNDSYWAGFTEGPIVYSVELHGQPGSVSEEQFQEIATAYHDRLTGE